MDKYMLKDLFHFRFIVEEALKQDWSENTRNELEKRLELIKCELEKGNLPYGQKV